MAGTMTVADIERQTKAQAALATLDSLEAQVQSARDSIATAQAQAGTQAEFAALQAELTAGEWATVATRVQALLAFANGG